VQLVDHLYIPVPIVNTHNGDGTFQNQQFLVLGFCVILTWLLPKFVKLLAGKLKMSSGPVPEVGCLSP